MLIMSGFGGFAMIGSNKLPNNNMTIYPFLERRAIALLLPRHLPKAAKKKKGASPPFAFCQCVFNPSNSSERLFLFRYSLLHQQIGRQQKQ